MSQGFVHLQGGVGVIEAEAEVIEDAGPECEDAALPELDPDIEAQYPRRERRAPEWFSIGALALQKRGKK